MKLQLDTTKKTIKVEETVNLNEFIETIEMLLPSGKWKEFDLDASPIIKWESPVIINPYGPYYPYVPEYPWIAYLSGKGDYVVNGGVYNIEI